MIIIFKDIFINFNNVCTIKRTQTIQEEKEISCIRFCFNNREIEYIEFSSFAASHEACQRIRYHYQQDIEILDLRDLQ